MNAMNRKLLALALFALMATGCAKSRCPTCVEDLNPPPPVECTQPTTWIQSKVDTLSQSGSVEVTVHSDHAAWTRIYESYNGQERTLAIMSAAVTDTVFYFASTEVGVHNIFLSAKAKDGDCRSPLTGISLLVIHDWWVRHMCEELYTVRATSPIYKACYQACPNEDVTGLRSYLKFRRSNSNYAEQTQGMIAMGYYWQDPAGSTQPTYWSHRTSGGNDVQVVKCSPGLDSEWNDLGVYGRPTYPGTPFTALFDVLVAHESLNGLTGGNPNNTTDVSFGPVLTVQEILPGL